MLARSKASHSYSHIEQQYRMVRSLHGRRMGVNRPFGPVVCILMPPSSDETVEPWYISTYSFAKARPLL